MGLQVKQLAAQLGADEQSLSYWEQGLWEPGLRHLPVVLRFLGYDPRPVPTDLAGKLKHHRLGFGLSQSAMARLVQVAPGTLSDWERGRRSPLPEFKQRLEEAVRNFGANRE